MTNYEKIKNMSIDEMADFIDNDNCCACCIYAYKGCSLSKDCRNGIRQWLESEAEQE